MPKIPLNPKGETVDTLRDHQLKLEEAVGAWLRAIIHPSNRNAQRRQSRRMLKPKHEIGADVILLDALGTAGKMPTPQRSSQAL